ncbi:BRCT domain [Macleaya cordata]|uniref:BRCT domain n=1 Tax=Macleaya cordata TaxID=56857 RepID=A0A200QS16_MACCD|nr:BRCT domain [Macleaya cordata]
MADSAHLEKMGRELKCPICLGLLNSTVSLSCNHMFCNSCIMESMKLGSECPVCKVPYRRREVRPAPHMDNLVSIYKSMEVASGINIFVTQNAQSTKESGQHDAYSGRQEACGTSNGKTKKQRKLKGKSNKSSNEPVDTKAKLSDSNPLEPSFPAKKRVHVPQCLLSETPMRSNKCVGEESGKNSELGPNDSSIKTMENPSFNDKGEPVLSPFFWLREDDSDGDVGKSSGQEMEIYDVMDTPRKAPCFSDIKDSDDDSPTKTTSTVKVHTESKVGDIFDSEMFEWTQRACSPELFSTPEKNKAGYQELNVIEEEECGAASQIRAATNGEMLISEKVKNMNCKQGNESIDVKLSPLKAKSAKSQNKIKKSKRKGKRNMGRAQEKSAKISTDEVVGEICIGLNEIGEILQGDNCDTNGTASNLRKKICKRSKKARFSDIAEDQETEDAHNESIAASKQNQENEQNGRELPTSSNQNLKSSKARSNNFSEDKDVAAAEVKVVKEVPMNQNQENENDNVQSPSLTGLKVDPKRTSDLEKRTRNTVKNANILVQRNCARESRERKRLKISADDSVKGGLVDDVLSGSSKADAKGTKTSKQFQGTLDNRAIENSKTTKKVISLSKAMFLQKCESLPVQIPCAFCQSSTDSEASGEMLHYFNGKPVAADYNGGSNVIHSHRNCTEWAPNVYFENDIAINLETELARSRRIKCCCCGVKGAALGCYEKSCRKSFHVPCAKLVMQCRWDTENFVMLCPLHSSSKLPKEILGSQGQRRKRSIPKGEPLAQQADVVVQHGPSMSRPWKCLGSPNKWVLCCSGLTISEKEVVSEFTRMTGVSVSKTFGPSVSHIIASTDENGACKRTMKFLMGILEGKWILNIDWIKACLKAMEPVSEEQYEVKVDIHGIKDGPRLGRLRVLNKQPKLFNSLKFYFVGEFMPSYKGDLQDLVVAAGGTVLHRKPIMGDRGASSGSSTSTFIIYSLELPDKCDPGKKILICNRRRDEAQALASSSGANVAGHSWLLDSIAACKLQNLT